MNLQGIYHRPKSNFCYAYNEDTVHIRLRASKNDLDKVILVYGDKYIWDEHKTIEMELKCSDKYFDYFTAEINPPFKRLAYYFILESNDERYYYTEWGFSKEINEKEIYLHFFEYPYINKIDVHEVPEWTKNAIFYQIFPERFYNGDKSNDPETLEEWGKLPERDSYFGGDLQGITEKLDYLSDLGITAIYLTPIFEAFSNHKYNTKDYMKIDPHFGDLDTIKELVRRCHERGIRVVLDAVFNHSGYYFEPFQDVIKRGKDSPYYDWFYIKKWPIETNPPSYETFAFVHRMPKLNTSNPEVREYLFNVVRYWMKEVDIDGWRLDVANEIDHDFWREFRKVVKGIKKDAYIVGEIWHDSLPWLMGDQFDAVMNYPFMRACIQYFARKNINEKEFMELINGVLMRNTQQVNEVMYNLLDSHDTSRFLTKCNGKVERLKLALTFLLTFPGAPSIYYGTEIGLEGGEDPDCRRTMDWNKENWNMELYELTKKLIKARNNYSALRTGSFEWIDGLNGIVGYKRKIEDQEILVFINNSSEDKEVSITEKGIYFDILDEKIFDNNEERLKFTVPRYASKVFVNTKK
jgi:glycosidase